MQDIDYGFTRTDLTEHETNALHATKRRVYESSFSIGAFIMRSNDIALREQAAALFLELLNALVSDANIRTGALGYGRDMARFSMNDRNASQAHQLRAEFLSDLYRAAVSERENAEAN